jgi:O-acetyl-ADP-ribose deacetylase (regulator of RNase III)
MTTGHPVFILIINSITIKEITWFIIMTNKSRKFSISSDQTLEVIQGDITNEKVDAIVNAANSQLMHGGGVAGAISRRGGDIIQSESHAWVKQHGPVTHEHPAYTHAGSLPCKYVIHAVGPIWGEGDEDHKLAEAVTGCLELAERLQLTSISFPAISTGIFGFPKQRAAEIFINTFQKYFGHHRDSSLRIVRVTILDSETTQIFLKTFQQNFNQL